MFGGIQANLRRRVMPDALGVKRGLQKDLADTGFISAEGKPWPELDAAAVRERLGNQFEEVA